MVPDQSISTATDSALVSHTRRGDRAAFRTLVARHLEAVRLAVSLLDGSPTLVRTTFDVAHGCLVRETGGSSDAVRPFLLALARGLHESPAPEGALLRGESFWCAPFRETVSHRHPAVAVEVSWLPPSWQSVLWHRLVERDDDVTIATVVGVAPGKVPSLVAGALDLLRRGLVVRHRKGAPPQCAGYGLRLERAGTTSVPKSVLRHAETCRRCAVLLDDLAAVGTDLAGVMAEALLSAAGEGYVAARVSTGSTSRVSTGRVSTGSTSRVSTGRVSTGSTSRSSTARG